MSKHRVLSLKPQLRLERQGQDGQNEMKQSDHSASLGDSITLSTRIRFSVHTGIPNYSETEAMSRIWINDPARELTAENLIELAYPTGSGDLPTSSGYHYSNTNYTLAG